MFKRKCKFANELKREFPYLKEAGNGNLLCNRSGPVFSISHGRRADVNSHFGCKNIKSLLKQLHPHLA